MEAIAAGLESDIGDRRLRAWARLHSCDALTVLRGGGVEHEAGIGGRKVAFRLAVLGAGLPGVDEA